MGLITSAIRRKVLVQLEALARRLIRTGAYLGPERYLAVNAHGHRMFLDPRDITVAPVVITDGRWEPGVGVTLERLLKPGDRVVEVGANFGFHTLHAAALVGETGRVITFEANPRLPPYLLDSAIINGFHERIEIRNLAVLDEEGPVTFHTRVRHMGNSSLGKASDEHLSGLLDELESVTVPGVTLDGELKGDDRRIDLLRIDAEGAEPKVIAGARAVIAENPRIKVILEWCPEQILGASGSARDLLDELAGHGMRFSRIAADGRPMPHSIAELMAVQHCDIVAERG